MTTDSRRALKIAFFHDLPSGGAKRTAFAQIRELVRRGHRVEVFLPSTAEEEFFPLSQVAHAVHTIRVPAQPNRERLLAGRPSLADALGWVRLFRGMLKGQKEAATRVDAGGFDAVVVHPSQFTQAPTFLRHTRTPSLYYCHEVLRAAYEPLITSLPIRLAIRATLGRLDRKAMRAATAVAANSAFTASRILEIYGRKSTPAPPGVDGETFHPSDGPRERHVLSVGAIHPLKGMELVVEALGLMGDDGRPPLVVVSDRHREAERFRLQKLAQDRGVALEIRSRISEEELRDLYAGARAVVAAAHKEPLGLVPLEAMACGTPVVAVDEGGFRETVAHEVTGFLVPRTPDAMAERLQWLLENPEAAEAMGSAGRKRVRSEWNWEAAVDRLEEIIRTVARKP